MQISLFDTYNEVLDLMEENKPEIIELIEEYIDFEAIIPFQFHMHYYRHKGRKRINPLSSFIKAFVLKLLLSIIFTRYMLIVVEKRINEDDRTAGEIFFLLCDEVRDISFNQSMSLLVQAFLDSAAEMFKLSNQQLSAFVECFLFKLPAYFRDSLLISYVDDYFWRFFPLGVGITRRVRVGSLSYTIYLLILISDLLADTNWSV